MKILALRLKNLNSLVGEWQIDFTAPPYAADGIFAITGPTGAGKSTILDAICLALYGRTPRLDRISKSINEIMSRQTGDCFAELTFETLQGRYRCHFSHHRARKKPTGELQHPRHEIACADSGAVLASSLREVATRVEQVTGMDFDRFTRSILLAQGGFAAFLQAAADERSPILEQITGTAIYSDISMRVHERHRQEREQLGALQAEMQGIKLLSTEEEQALAGMLEQQQQALKGLREQQAQTVKAINWLETIDSLERELASLEQEAATISQAIIGFGPHQQRLHLAEAAARLDAQYAGLQALRAQQVADTGEQTRLQAEQPKLQERMGKAVRAYQQANDHHTLTRQQLQQLMPLWQRVRALDQVLAERQRQHAEESRRSDELSGTAQSTRRALKQLRADKAKQAAELEEANRYLTVHARDEWLLSGLTDLEERFSNLQGQEQALQAKQKQLQALKDQVRQQEQAEASAIKTVQAKNKALEGVLSKQEEAVKQQAQLLDGRLLREYRNQREGLLRELVLMRQVVQLEELRARLEKNQPCPLCGALEHPWAQGYQPEIDNTEAAIQRLDKLITAAEEGEDRLAVLREQVEAAREALRQAEQEQERLQLAIEAAQALEKVQQQQLSEQQAGQAALQIRLQELLEPWAQHEGAQIDSATLLAQLQGLRQRWLQQVERQADAQKQQNHLESSEKSLEAVLATQEQNQQEQAATVEAQAERLLADQIKRQVLFGQNQVDAEQVRLERILLEAEQVRETAFRQQADSQRTLDALETRLRDLSKRLTTRKPQLHTTENTFLDALKLAKFADEAAFTQARLGDEERQNLQAKAQKLAQQQADCATRQKDRRERLAAEVGRKLTTESVQNLALLSASLEADIEAGHKQQAALQHQQADNQAAAKCLADKRVALEGQQREFERWDILHELIGSADGKKYRNFAQGLTFERVVAHANRQLQKMTDRYLLVRSATQPLELNVLDNYQAGEERSTKNLSGGESFIVSLALALGLSQMASRNVRVDSLFLDEGFGTLDDDTLDTALDTLAGLQQEGKLIGVISHVAALKDRISTQINVEPAGGGRSRITGPGVSQAVAG